jgi:predicted GIY-YIG superfamily endonuclease
MPAGRPTNGVIYGLVDRDGKVFYVGQTKNLKKRISAYKSGRFHQNGGLADMISMHGVNPVVLRDDPDNLTEAEFEEISERSGLVNLILSKDEALRYAKSTKPWAVAGLQLPSTIYMRHMRNAFGQSCEWLKRHIVTLSQEDRLSLEKRFSDTFAASTIGRQCKEWRDAIDARS